MLWLLGTIGAASGQTPCSGGTCVKADWAALEPGTVFGVPGAKFTLTNPNVQTCDPSVWPSLDGLVTA